MRAGVAFVIAGAFLGAAALLVAVAPLGAQTVFQLEGGGNSITGGYGGRMQFWSGPYEGWIGAGYTRGWRLGFFVKRPFFGDTLRGGFDVQPMGMTTDIFSSGSYLLTQGLAWRRRHAGFDATIFGGATGAGVGAPFVNTARAEKPLGLAVVDWKATSSLLLQTRAVAARQQTLLQTVAWTSPNASHNLAATGGVGANHPFGAVTWKATTERVELRAGYVDFAQGFRRADAPIPNLAEPYHENVQLTVRAPKRASLSVGHQNFRQDDTLSLTPVRATVDQVVGNLRLFGVTLGSGVFQTRSGTGNSLSTFNSVNRALPFGANGTLLLFQTFRRDANPIRSVQAELHVPVTSTLSLSQVFAQTGKSVSAGLGGRYQSGFTTIALDYQNYYVPLREPNPFMRALTLTVRLQLGNSSANIGTAIDPFGRVTYSASGSTYLYLGEMATGIQPITIRFERYVIRGIVEDVNGAPVDGAAVDAGGEMALTNSRGEFFIRTKNRRSTPFRVAFDDFLAIGSYELVSAPASVMPDEEERAIPVRVVLRTPPPKPRSGGRQRTPNSSAEGAPQSHPAIQAGAALPKIHAAWSAQQCGGAKDVLGRIYDEAARTWFEGTCCSGRDMPWRFIKRPLPHRM